MKNKFSLYSSSTKLLIKEASKRKIQINYIYPGNLLEFVFNDHQEYIYNQQISKTSCVALQICKHKEITKILLKKSGLNITKGIIIDIKKPLMNFEKNNLKYPIITKPLFGAHGDLIFTNINNINDLKQKITNYQNKYDKILIEEQFIGNDYRIFATKEKTIAIIKRVPANIIGDGVNNIKQLIEIKNRDSRRKDSKIHGALTKIKIDNIVLSYLKMQKISLNYIPKKNKVIFLRNNANISTGGDSIDCTDKAHESVKKIAVRAINAIPGLCYGGVDIMTKDITKKQNKSDYVILEVNANPGFDMHHFPYQGKPRNIAKEIIDVAFPETKK